MTEASRGVLDTSVLIDHDLIAAEQLPDESAITSVTLAELAAGPHATENPDERARRQDRLQWATATSPAGASKSPTRGRVKLPHLTAAGRGMITRFDAPWQGVPRIP
jgi:predicted nucleic acid-binding protein